MTPQLVGVFIPIMGMLLGLVAIIGGFRNQSQKMKLRMMELQAGSSVVQDETTKDLQRLKDRVAVLERLLTDDDRKLAGEIERLRSQEAQR
jgi:hypothetical protein